MGAKVIVVGLGGKQTFAAPRTKVRFGNFTFARSILPNVRPPHIQIRQEAMVTNWTLGQFHQALMDEGKNETLEVPKRCVQNLCYFEKAVFSVTIGDHVHHDADAIC